MASRVEMSAAPDTTEIMPKMRAQQISNISTDDQTG